MRIERIVGRSYAEASDTASSRFGSETMILSTSKVGSMTELLVAIESNGNRRKPASVAQMFATSPIVATPAQPPPAEQPGGAAMVDTIRSELLSLERKLAAVDQQVASSHRCLTLVELGISPAYAECLRQAGNGSSAYASQLLTHLKHRPVTTLPDHSQLLVVGPPGSGRTTAALQMAYELRRKSDSPRPLIGLKDPRPGARERFFLLSDLCGLHPGWHTHCEPRAVIDAGVLSMDQCANWDGGGAPVTKILCVAATTNPLTARRWLDSLVEPGGVIISFWDAESPPIGLLSQLAQTGVPLLGVSASPDPRDRLQLPSDEVLQIALEASFATCVATEQGQAA